MTTATLTFNLNDQDDKCHFALANKAIAMSIVLSKYSDILRSMAKHGMPEALKTPDDVLHYLKNNFHELLSEYDLYEIL